MDLYSQDILMMGFPDATSLSAALVSMERQPLAPGVSTVNASLSVISCLVQAARTHVGTAALEDAMLFLGRVGIR